MGLHCKLYKCWVPTRVMWSFFYQGHVNNFNFWLVIATDQGHVETFCEMLKLLNCLDSNCF